MYDTRRVLMLLRELETKLERFRVVDKALRDSILAAHRESGMTEEAPLVVVLRRPATQAALEALESLVQKRFGAGLPPAMRALLASHDGIWVGEADPASEVSTLLDSPYEDGILDCASMAAELEREVSAETSPDGTRRSRCLPVLPFYDVPDQGWHALDYSRQRADGRVPVITWYFDEDACEEPGAETEGRQVIAASFSEWLESWVASGFDTFWFEQAKRSGSLSPVELDEQIVLFERLESALLKKPLGGSKKPASFKSVWRDFQDAIFRSVNRTGGSEADVFDIVRKRFSRDSSQAAFARKLVEITNLQQDLFARSFEDSSGQVHPELLETRRGMPEILSHARLLRTIGYPDAGRDLAFDAYQRMRELIESFRGQPGFKGLLGHIRDSLKLQPYKRMGFEELQEWIDRDFRLLEQGPSKNLPDWYQNSFETLARKVSK